MPGKASDKEHCHTLNEYICKTRMHSSRMHTIRCLSPCLVLKDGARALYMTPFSNRMTDSHVGEGGLSRGCLPGGYTPLPRGQTDTCKNITFPQLLLRTVNITYWKMFRSFSILKNIACHNCVNLTTNGNVPRGKSIYIITRRHFIRMPTACLCGVFVVNVCREGGTCVVRSKMNKFEHVWAAGPCMEGGTDTRALYRVVWRGGG